MGLGTKIRTRTRLENIQQNCTYVTNDVQYFVLVDSSIVLRDYQRKTKKKKNLITNFIVIYIYNK